MLLSFAMRNNRHRRIQRDELFPYRQLSRSIVLSRIDWRIAGNSMGKFLARRETGTHPHASNIPAISRQLFARESARITCRCLSVFNYYRRRSHDRNIPVGCHPGRDAREEEAEGISSLSLSLFANMRVAARTPRDAYLPRSRIIMARS